MVRLRALFIARGVFNNILGLVHRHAVAIARWAAQVVGALPALSRSLDHRFLFYPRRHRSLLGKFNFWHFHHHLSTALLRDHLKLIRLLL